MSAQHPAVQLFGNPGVRLCAHLAIHNGPHGPLAPQLVSRMVHKQHQRLVGEHQVLHGLQQHTDQLVQGGTSSIYFPEGLIQLGQPLLLSPAQKSTGSAWFFE